MRSYEINIIKLYYKEIKRLEDVLDSTENEYEKTLILEEISLNRQIVDDFIKYIQ